MPGKYDAILPSLPSMPVENQSYQDKVEQVKAALTAGSDAGCTPTALDLAQLYAQLRATKDVLEDQVSAINLQLEAVTQLLVASQDAGEEGWGAYGVEDNAIRMADGSTIRVQFDITGQVKDKEAYRLWCLENGYGQKMQLWPTTTNAIVKERLMAGEPEPAGVQAFKRNKLVFVGAKA